MSSPKLPKPCSSCTECQRSRQRCFFDTPDATECSRCITRGLQYAFGRSFQGSRKKQKYNSSIVDEDQGGVDILDRQIGENLLSTPVSGPPLCPDSVSLALFVTFQDSRSIVDEDQGGVDILDRQIGDNLLSTPVSGPPLCSESVKFGFYAKNQIAFCETYTKGGGDVWYPTPSEELVHIRSTIYSVQIYWCGTR